MADVIDPDAITVPAAKLDQVETAGGNLASDGETIGTKSADIHSDWQGLSPHYEAPESGQLFSATKMVSDKGSDIDDNLGTVGSALKTFAADAEAPLRRIKNLKNDAEDLRGRIDDKGDDWREDEDLVNEHNDLNDDILAALVEYQEHERTCANAITGIFGGTTFIAANPDGSTKAGKGEEIYGLSEAVEGMETPWAKPQEYDAPWYEDVWNGGKDFVVGIAEDAGGLVGLYGEDGWGVSSWGEWGSNLATNWEGLAGGLVGLVGFHGPDGWGWQGWGNLGNNWKELAHGFVPWREWDGGNGAGYVITQGALNIGSSLVGYGVVKNLIKGGRRGGDVDAPDADRPDVDLDRPDGNGSLLPDGGRGSDLPTTRDLQNTIDDIDTDGLGNLDNVLDRADGLQNTRHADTPDGTPDQEPAHVGGRDDAGDNTNPPDNGNTNGPGNSGGTDTRPDGDSRPDTDPDTRPDGDSDVPPPRDGSDGGNNPDGDTDGPGGHSDPDDPDSYRSPERDSPEYEQRRDELAQDPAKNGKINAKSTREAEVGLELERTGDLPGPIRRAPLDDSDPAFQRDQGDFIDGNGQHWDVKAPKDLFPEGSRRAGETMPAGQKGKFDLDELEDQVRGEFDRVPPQKVAIDARDLSPGALSQVREMIERNGWQDAVKLHDADSQGLRGNAAPDADTPDGPDNNTPATSNSPDTDGPDTDGPDNNGPDGPDGPDDGGGSPRPGPTPTVDNGGGGATPDGDTTPDDTTRDGGTATTAPVPDIGNVDQHGIRRFDSDGDGDAYGRAVWDDSARNLSDDQLEAVRDYGGEVAQFVNKVLRDPALLDTLPTGVARRLPEQIDLMDQALATTRVPEDIAVVRGTGADSFRMPDGTTPDMDNLGELEGTVQRDPAFMSTSLGKNPAYGDKPVWMHLDVPKGTPGTYMPAVNAIAGERELLLGRGTPYVVDKVTFENGTWHVHGRFLTGDARE